MYVFYLRAFKPVEPGSGSDTVCSDVFSIQVISNFQVHGKLHGLGNLVEAVAGRTDNGAHLSFSLFERIEIGDPVIKHHP
jgi:hypothetical protein